MSDKSQMPHLVCSDSQEITVDGHLTIGRLPECSVQLKSSNVSRRHALLKVVNQQVVLSDLNSSNGTWLNDQKIISPTELHDGDRLRISKTVFVFKGAVRSVQTKPPPAQPHPAPKERPKTAIWQTDVSMTLVRSDNGAEFGLNHSIGIGRDETNDLVLKGDDSASNSHAKIELVERQLVISDLNSRLCRV
jgi:pSer/pThr/pTyr-binding forkhead associated (FHA) protein